MTGSCQLRADLNFNPYARDSDYISPTMRFDRIQTLFKNRDEWNGANLYL